MLQRGLGVGVHRRKADRTSPVQPCWVVVGGWPGRAVTRRRRHGQCPLQCCTERWQGRLKRR